MYAAVALGNLALEEGAGTSSAANAASGTDRVATRSCVAQLAGLMQVGEAKSASVLFLHNE